jgi:hypothetical protein
MPGIIHGQTAMGQWYTLSLAEQLGNIGSEVGRAANWEKKGNTTQRDHALERAFDLLDLTLDDNRLKQQPGRLRELCRAREILVDTFWGEKYYLDTPEKLEKYFFQFAVAARKNK